MQIDLTPFQVELVTRYRQAEYRAKLARSDGTKSRAAYIRACEDQDQLASMIADEVGKAVVAVRERQKMLAARGKR